MDVACRMGTPVYVGQVMGELMKIASHNWHICWQVHSARKHAT